MNNRRPVVGIVLLLLVGAGLACLWEAWDYNDSAGVLVFRYRDVLLPWQEAQTPPAMR